MKNLDDEMPELLLLRTRFHSPTFLNEPNLSEPAHVPAKARLIERIMRGNFLVLLF